MAANVDITRIRKPELRSFLSARGMSLVDYSVEQLRELALKAIELKLPIVSTADYTCEFLNCRSCIVIDGEKVVFPVVFSSDLSNWCRDLSVIPVTSHADIFLYLLSCAKWSRERLNGYKSERGYRLYMANHVHSVELHKLSHNHLYIRSKCIRETSQTAVPYTTWCLMNMDGTFVSAGCECTEDDGSCKHVVALLFSLVYWSDRHIDRNTASCTDNICVWDNPRKESKPQKLNDIELSEKSRAQPTENTYNPLVKSVNDNFDVEQSVYTLMKGSDAQIIEVLESEHAGQSPKCLIDLALEFNHQDSFRSFIKSYFNQEMCHEIETLTVGQSENPVWFEHRKGRLTASMIPLAYSYRGNDPDNYVVRNVLDEIYPVSTVALEYGKERESLARNLYETEYIKKHNGASISIPGLIVNENMPHLGASPDCVVQCKCCGKGLAEIKCPYKFKNLTIDGICAENYHVYKDGTGKMKLKEKSQWYIQIQSQMAIANAEWCDFILYLEGSVENGKHKIHVQRIIFDKDLWESIVIKIDFFFEKFILPKLLS